MNNQRLIIVANRLPVHITNDYGSTGIHPVSGGLVSAIKSFLQHSHREFSDILWAGVPGCSTMQWEDAIGNLRDSEFSYLPVFPKEEQYEKYYNGFSNSVLWSMLIGNTSTLTSLSW